MTSQSAPSAGGSAGQAPSDRLGCLPRGMLFGAAAIVAALLILYLYGVVVETHGWIAVRREFGYDMMLYAPLGGLVFASAAAGWAGTRTRARRLGVVLLAMGALVILVHLYLMTR